MFASLDGGSNRTLKALASTAGRSQELNLPVSLERRARKAEIHPTDRRLDDLAAHLVRRHAGEVDEIRVEVWRIDFAPRTLDPTWRLLNARSVVVPSAAD